MNVPIALSNRGLEMPASPIRRLMPHADKARARGIKVYHLNIGQPDVETPAEMMAAYNAAGIKVLAYGPSGGLKSYVDGLAGYYARVGIKVAPEDILITTGGSEALSFVFKAVADAGDEIIVPEPFYTNYLGFAAMSCVRIVPVTCHADDGFALPDRKEFERRITDRTRAILYSNPGNPTGAIYTPKELEMLRHLALDHNLFLIADEVYREFTYGDAEPESVLNLPGIADRAVLVDSVSKRYSACGARVGCIVSRNAELMKVCLKFGQARLCPPTIDQLAAAAALKVPDSYFQQVRDEYRRRRDLMCAALDKMPGVVCHKPKGAFYSMVKLPVTDAEQFAIFMLDDFDVDKETVMVAPGNGFYATAGAGRDEVRIAYVLNTTDLARAMEILALGLKAFNA